VRTGDLVVAHHETWIYYDYQFFNSYIIATVPRGGVVVYMGESMYTLHKVMYDGVVGWANRYDLDDPEDNFCVPP